MSIILKGIDIPKEGEWLEIIIKPTKEVIIDTIRYRDNALLKTEYDSAIQIPKGHGRIGDLGGVIKQAYYLYPSIDHFSPSIKAVEVKAIENAPTILEAEEIK